MLMLDTNVCSYLILEKEPWISSFDASSEDLGISSVVAMELHRWANTPGISDALRECITTFLNAVPVFPFDSEAALSSSRVLNGLMAKSIAIGAYDPLIAGHAISTASTLVTNNQKDFRHVAGLSYKTQI